MRAFPGFLACALLWSTSAVAPADRAAAQLEAGLFLYAAPRMADPNFAKTVVLLVEHGSHGSLGLVVNRPTDLALERVFDVKPGSLGVDLPLYWGGPVQPTTVLALVRLPRSNAGARAVLPGVQVTGDLDEVKRAFAERDAALRVRVFSGYAGWDRGQLEAEVRRGNWVLDRADAASVFSPEPSRLWDRVHEILGRLQARG